MQEIRVKFHENLEQRQSTKRYHISNDFAKRISKNGGKKRAVKPSQSVGIRNAPITTLGLEPLAATIFLHFARDLSKNISLKTYTLC